MFTLLWLLCSKPRKYKEWMATPTLQMLQRALNIAHVSDGMFGLLACEK